jgi:hypothetical protein
VGAARAEEAVASRTVTTAAVVAAMIRVFNLPTLPFRIGWWESRGVDTQTWGRQNDPKARAHARAYLYRKAEPRATRLS